MSKIFKLAKKFERKIALAEVIKLSNSKKSKSDDSEKDLKDEAKEKFARIFDEMTNIIHESGFFKPIMEAGLNAWSTYPLNDNAKKAIELGAQIISGITYIHNLTEVKTIDQIDLAQMLGSAESIKNAIAQIVNSKGIDQTNQKRENFLFLYDLESSKKELSAHTSQINNISLNEINEAVRKERLVFNKLIHLITARNKINDIIAKLVRNKIYTLDEINSFSMMDTSVEEDMPSIEHTARDLTPGESGRILEQLAYELGLDKLGLLKFDVPDEYWQSVYNKYIVPLGLQDELRAIRNGLLRADVLLDSAPDSEKYSPNIIHLYYKNSKEHKYKRPKPLTIQRIKNLKQAIHDRHKEIQPKEELMSSKLQGDPEYRAYIEGESFIPESTITESVSEKINKLTGLDLHAFNIIPIPVQIDIRNGKVNLDAALQIARSNSHLIPAKSSLKLDPVLFEVLRISPEAYSRGGSSPILIDPIFEEEEIIDPKSKKSRKPSFGLSKEEINEKANSMLRGWQDMYVRGKPILNPIEQIRDAVNQSESDFKRLITAIVDNSSTFGEAFREEVISIIGNI